MNAFTLRGHSSSIVALERFPKSIISADSSGLVIRWDLPLKRKLYSWQAHLDLILTLQYIGGSHLLTHSRDSHLRIWNLTQDSAIEIFELPVNALNFSNVVSFDEYLITPATINSNNFDIYKLVDDTVNRVVTNFSAYDLYVKENRVVSISNSELGRNDFGIIMRMDFLAGNILSLGFESGHVVVMKIDLLEATTTTSITSHTTSKLVINREPKISLIYASEAHIPNPVTTLTHNGTTVFSGSTNKKVFLHDIATDLSEFKVIKSSSAGIRSLAVRKNSTSVLIGHWNGTIEEILESNQVLEIRRDVPVVDLVKSISNSEAKRINSVKLTCMILLEAEKAKTILGSYKNRAVSRRLNTEDDLIYAGYDDGVIFAYKLTE